VTNSIPDFLSSSEALLFGENQEAEVNPGIRRLKKALI
jgi:hypothetical protein